MDKRVMDGETAETAETVAGVVRLLQRAAVLEWARSDAEGPRSARQMSALGIDVLVGEALDLLPTGLGVGGPVPPGDDPAGLLRSAESLLLTLVGGPGASAYSRLAGRVGDLVWELNAHASQ
ncbi:MAG: hypothetical protein ABIQ18_05615, partial [Umezawaea sp.]